VTRTERYYTSFPGQREVDIQIFQGDNEDALQNVLVGDFHVEGLATTDGPNEVLCRMSLDIDGILHVAAIEKRTGKSKHITIANALQAKSDAEIAAARQRITDLYSLREAALEDEEDEGDGAEEEAEAELVEPAWEDGVVEVEVQKTNGKIIPMDSNWVEHRHEAVDLVQRSRRLLDGMHAEDNGGCPPRLAGACRSREISQGASLFRGGQLMCPVCQARFRGSTECSRCGADLRTIMDLAAGAWRLREAARQAIAEGDLERARALAAQSQEICRTPAGRDLEMVSSWLAGASPEMDNIPRTAT
jgi:hypothetical protein